MKWLSYRELQAFRELFYWLLAGLWRWLSYAEIIYSENDWECSDWLSYAGGALIKVADSAGSTVAIFGCMVFRIIPEFRNLRLTLYGKLASKCCIRLNLKVSLGYNYTPCKLFFVVGILFSRCP